VEVAVAVAGWVGLNSKVEACVVVVGELIISCFFLKNDNRKLVLAYSG
jgi:hypothetical protein